MKTQDVVGMRNDLLSERKGISGDPADAIRDMFLDRKYNGRVPDKDIKTMLASKGWHRMYGKDAVLKAWKELVDEGYAVLKDGVWIWLTAQESRGELAELQLMLKGTGSTLNKQIDGEKFVGDAKDFEDPKVKEAVKELDSYSKDLLGFLDKNSKLGSGWKLRDAHAVKSINIKRSRFGAGIDFSIKDPSAGQNAWLTIEVMIPADYDEVIVMVERPGYQRSRERVSFGLKKSDLRNPKKIFQGTVAFKKGVMEDVDRPKAQAWVDDVAKKLGQKYKDFLVNGLIVGGIGGEEAWIRMSSNEKGAKKFSPLSVAGDLKKISGIKFNVSDSHVLPAMRKNEPTHFF